MDENLPMSRASLVIKYGTKRTQVAANFQKKVFWTKQATWQFFGKKFPYTTNLWIYFFINKIRELYVFYQFSCFITEKSVFSFAQNKK
jgi:hypothetical protein